MSVLLRSAAIVGLLSCGLAQAFDPNLRYAFVTSTSGSGDLSSWGVDAAGQTGLLAADAICQARAAAGGLPQPSQFVAWLSDDDDDAYCRVFSLHGKRSLGCGQSPLPTNAGPWWRVDGTAFAGSADEAFSMHRVLRTLDIDEFNHPSSAGRTFTATDESGERYAFLGTCGKWTLGTGNTLSGLLDGTGNSWSTGFFQDCAGPRPLYCLQRGSGAALPAGWHHGRPAFISASTSNGNFGAHQHANGASGAAAADEICRHDAGAYGLPRPTTFRAWISAPGVPAASRFVNDGPWYRTDGVRVATTLAQMQTSGLEQPLNRVLTLNEPYWGPIGLWTGTLGNGAPAAETCSGWTSGVGPGSGYTGTADHRDAPWTDASEPHSCDNFHPVYCLADNDTLFAHGYDR